MEHACVSSLLVLWLSLLPPVLICILLLSYLWTFQWLRPERIRQRLRRQGEKGPKPSLLLRNIPEMRRIQKQLAESDQEQQEAAAGGNHRFSSNYMAAWPLCSLTSTTGTRSTSLFVRDPDMVRELANCKSLDLGKPRYLQKQLGALLGTGILTANGDLWAHQRKVIASHFFMDKVKGMVDLMAGSANEMLVSWEDIVDRGGFHILSKIRQLQVAMAKQDIFAALPGSRYLPTKRNREIRRRGASIRDLILDIARRHEEEHDPPATSSASNSDGFLRSIVEGAKAAASAFSSCTPEDFIVDNCKNIYFAGHETTSTTAAWCLMLLAAHPEWQSRARAEVMEVVRHGKPLDADTIRKLKTVTMVVQETLRLYPPAPFVTREALRDLTLGGLHVPSGTGVRVPIALAHRDPAAWGHAGGDPDGFDPGRFANGVNLAVVELKVVLALLLPRFELALSPGYVHRPAFRLTVEPGNGVALVLRKLCSAD
ncbi:unnamed protein product [Miscanthus lutarioriparius]|uniref:Cytochrome P450 n=1 Tax=Miscanthus lutarioriparius TaxID=422564 RepID=A0A811QLV9_9POAL|nr:unnamed protein product [Miscanthus lutarioriparius]